MAEEEATEETTVGSDTAASDIPDASGAPTEAGAPEADKSQRTEGGTYELLARRLARHAEELYQRAQTLNEQRVSTFGSTAMEIVGNERIRTENNAVARDIESVGNHLLFGYNVFVGLKDAVTVQDVFSLHKFSRGEDDNYEFTVVPEETDFLQDEKFTKAFSDLYTYYRDARLLDLKRSTNRLMMVFQVGGTVDDIKVFRWAIDPDGTATYLDDRGEQDYKFPPAHDFKWKTVERDAYTGGVRPRISVADAVFIDPRNGTLDFLVEDNTDQGKMILSEPVNDPGQSLADCAVSYTKIGSLVLVQVLPYREDEPRFFVYNTRTSKAVRLDSIGQSCQQLPEDHGIVFPGGYYLQDGTHRTFDVNVDDMEFEESIRSPNGEDVLFVFHHRETGEYVLLSYNLIRREVGNPLHCNGFSLFGDGTMVVFRPESGEPTRVHHMQVWSTPFVSDEFHAAVPKGDSFLHRIGNADLVRGISDAFTIRKLAVEAEPTLGVYDHIVTSAAKTIDSYHWLGHQEVGNLIEPLKAVQETAALVISEFEKVEEQKRQAKTTLEEVSRETRRELDSVRNGKLGSAEEFTDAMSSLRRLRGRIATASETRYVDQSRLDALDEEIAGEFDALAARTVEFLSGETAFIPFRARAEKLVEQSEGFETVVASKEVFETVEKLAEDMAMLAEVVGGLDVSDPTVTTDVLHRISEVVSEANRARAIADRRRSALVEKEQSAAFGAEFSLVAQNVQASLAQADTPDKADELLGRVMLQLENLEARFGESDRALNEITQKREEVYEAFTSRKQALLDDWQRRSNRLAESSDRLLKTVQRRAAQAESAEEVHAFFASDPMVRKIRSVIEDLRKLGAMVKAEEVAAALKAASQDATRTLRDRQDIYEDSGNLIRLGRHRFGVNTRDIELTMVPDGDGMAFAVAGTDYRERVTDETFTATSKFWNQSLVSETKDVYRGEFLAVSLFLEAEQNGTLNEVRADRFNDDALLNRVRSAVEKRYDEGYELGVHDRDTANILNALLGVTEKADLLRFPPDVRAAGQFVWASHSDDADVPLEKRARSMHDLRRAFPGTDSVDVFIEDLMYTVEAEQNMFGAPKVDAGRVARYLFEELGRDQTSFVRSSQAQTLADDFMRSLESTGDRVSFNSALEGYSDDEDGDRFNFIHGWVKAYAVTQGHEWFADEATAILAFPDLLRRSVDAPTATKVSGLLGQHDRISDGELNVQADEMLRRVGEYVRVEVPEYRAYQQQRHMLLEQKRAAMHLDEFKPHEMSTFVRNGLIDQVYLPLIGDNFAKQLGAAGDERRTDQMGLLLLLSPPGYGKTVLAEWVASRLGLVMVKINGPALGHDVVSLDPADAPNATARREIEKVNMAFEMANNVMLYVDDIQHTSAEFLQKFIPVADSQRRAEGVLNGEPKTYDLRGKRFCIVMAGNPYTESGEMFRIPDMLANRADTYNLGDVLSGNEELFSLSYIENSLTANPALASLSGGDRNDLMLLVRMARGEAIEADQLSRSFSATELQDIVSMLEKILAAQKVVMSVNGEYVASAAQSDDYRTEPPFQLQGSYRNMNKLVEKIVPVMSGEELQTLLDDHYRGEAQTLTTGAEQNLLKLAELRGRMSDEQQERWQSIKAEFSRRNIAGDSDDPLDRIAGQIGALTKQLEQLSRRDA